VSLRPGLVVAALFLCVYGTFALTVDVPRATYGFKSDEATYYMQGLSLVHDWDLTYRKEDLVRVWREFPSGPAGVFLKRGSKIDGRPDPARSRFFYGKSFIYPLFAAPLIAVFGTNGFLLLNVVCLALVLVCGYLFLHARAPAWPSAILAAGFVMASVVPVYVVQIMPEVFTFSVCFLAYFCWLYKEVAAPERSPRGTQWLFTSKSDVAMAMLLGIATFSKITNALLFAAPGLVWMSRLRLSRAKAGVSSSGFFLAIPAFLVVAGGLFGINMAISGDWNYQGGGPEVRKAYYYEFPFQNDVPVHQLGVSKSRDTAMTQVIFNPRTFRSNLFHNLEYFFIGRYAGLLPYFFPGFSAMLLMLSAPRRRPGWQWLVLGTALASGLVFLIATPYTWSGGGVGNRYFFGGYSVMLFVMPAMESIAAALVPWIVGALFVAPAVLNPFTASFRPADLAKAGPLRALPIELTLLNDLPVFSEGEARSRVEFGNVSGSDPAFLVSFLDDNAYGREADRSFWTRGDSRADLVFKVGGTLARIDWTVAAGPVPVDLRIVVDGHETRVHLDAGESTQTSVSPGSGLPYEKEVQDARLYNVRIYTGGGFTPIFFDPAANDARYLGARLKPMLVPGH
jgi:hypothetical protein